MPAPRSSSNASPHRCSACRFGDPRPPRCVTSITRPSRMPLMHREPVNRDLYFEAKRPGWSCRLSLRRGHADADPGCDGKTRGSRAPQPYGIVLNRSGCWPAASRTTSTTSSPCCWEYPPPRCAPQCHHAAGAAHGEAGHAASAELCSNCSPLPAAVRRSNAPSRMSAT